MNKEQRTKFDLNTNLSNNKMTVSIKWNVSEILKTATEEDLPTACLSYNNFAIVLLNQPILNEAAFLRLWDKAKIRCIVDGGGNQWEQVRKNNPNILHPHILSGDFDSIQPTILQLFKERGDVQIIATPSQDETDFTKTLRILQDELKSAESVTKIVAYCESSGRFDQIMANIETLFHATSILPKHQLFLMGSKSMAWLLRPGDHCIQLGNLSSVVRYCSLVPVGSPCISITTTGLRWNLTEDKLAFGHLVSTSNEIDRDNKEGIVTVKNSDPILWSLEMGAE